MMSPRERVLDATSHKKVDRPPADFEATQDVIDRLLKRLGLNDNEELLRYFGVDFRRVGMSYHQPDTGPDADGYLRNLWGLKWNPSKATTDPEHVIIPFNEDTTVDDVYNHQWPSPDAIDYSGLKAQCDKYYDDYITYGSTWAPFFHEVGWLIGQERYFTWMITKPEVVEAITDCIVSYELEVTRRFFETCKGKLDVAYWGNDFGTQRGIVISPAMWERFVRKYLKRIFDISHDYGCIVMQHSCGSVRAIVPQMIEDGMNILNPIQVQANGMSLEGLVRDFGSVISFYGAVNTQSTLPFGTPQDVREQVRAYKKITNGTGYIMAGSQVLIEDIPTDNILAMYDENNRK